MSNEIKVDMSRAIKKTAVLLKLSSASKKQATTWSSRMVTKLKRSAKTLKKSGRATGFMSDNVGQSIVDEGREILLGTGVGGAKNIIYANPQDRGATIRPRKVKYLAIPFKGVDGIPSNYSKKDTFILKLKTGNLAIMKKPDSKGGKAMGLFTLVKKVKIPRTGWFTDILNLGLPELSAMMKEEAILKKAEDMAGVKI